MGALGHGYRCPGALGHGTHHISPGTCAEEEGGQAEEGGAEHGHSHHKHGSCEEIEYPLSPVDPNAKGEAAAGLADSEA